MVCGLWPVLSSVFIGHIYRKDILKAMTLFVRLFPYPLISGWKVTSGKQFKPKNFSDPHRGEPLLFCLKMSSIYNKGSTWKPERDLSADASPQKVVVIDRHNDEPWFSSLNVRILFWWWNVLMSFSEKNTWHFPNDSLKWHQRKGH